MAVYYCISGNIYQSPQLVHTLHCRLHNSIFNIRRAMEYDVEHVKGKRNKEVWIGYF